ncbi:MAG: nucleoside-diphosphate kinase [Deltaproteobacteria bacterium]|nr:nucleoside-diphosphate kinase [Deltaproteobacteria bacterium]
MHMERTLSMIKPDGVRNGHIGEIIARFEKAGLKIAAMRLQHLTKEEAGKFYEVHSERPFYQDLVDFISSGPIVAMALEGENAIAKNRELMGATNPAEAAEGTIRKDFAKSIDENTVHGSDAVATAKTEISFFFTDKDFV